MDRYLQWKGWDGQAFGQFGREEALYFRKELRVAGIPALHGQEVGELGFGNGAFAAWVRAEGGRWSGREAHPELQRRAREAGFRALAEGEAWPTGSLDLLAAFDVLEHLDVAGIRAFLAEASASLRPGGLLLFRVPSGDSPFSGAIYRGDLTHRTLLGSLAIRQLALEAGLEVRQIRPPALPILGLGPLRALRRAIVRVLQGLVHGFLRRFILGMHGLVLSPDLVAVLQRPGEQA